MSDSVPAPEENVQKSLADVQLEASEGDSTASTSTPVGSVDTADESTSLTNGLPTSQNETSEEPAASTESPEASTSEPAIELPADGVVTRAMLESYLHKLLKNMPLSTEETKYLCDRVRAIEVQV